MAKRIRALSNRKILSTICRCKEAEDGEHECPALEALELIEARHKLSVAKTTISYSRHANRVAYNTAYNGTYKIVY